MATKRTIPPTLSASLFTERDAADYLKISESWLQKRRSSGTPGPRFVRVGRAVRYRRSDLDRYLEESAVEHGGAVQ